MKNRHFMQISVLLVFFTLNSCVQEQAQTITDVVDVSTEKKVTMTTHFDANYAHIVYFWLKNPESATDRKAFETALRLFLETSDYAKTNFIGTPPVASRDVVDDSFTYNLVVTFESAAAQEKYQEEASHKKFIADASHLWEKVIVYDATSPLQ